MLPARDAPPCGSPALTHASAPRGCPALRGGPVSLRAGALGPPLAPRTRPWRTPSCSWLSGGSAASPTSPPRACYSGASAGRPRGVPTYGPADGRALPATSALSGKRGGQGGNPHPSPPGAAALLRPRRHQACPWVQGHLARPEGPRLLPRRHRPPGATPEGDPRGPHRLHRRRVPRGRIQGASASARAEGSTWALRVCLGEGFWGPSGAPGRAPCLGSPPKGCEVGPPRPPRCAGALPAGSGSPAQDRRDRVAGSVGLPGVPKLNPRGPAASLLVPSASWY